MRRALRAAVVAMALASLASCSELTPATGVIVVIAAEPSIAASSSDLVVRVYGADATSQTGGEVISTQRAIPLGGSVTLPYSFAVGPIHSDASRVYRVEVDALDSGGHVLVTSKLISGYVARTILRVDLVIEGACRAIDCAASTSTCRAGVCVDAHVDANTLPVYESGVDAGSP